MGKIRVLKGKCGVGIGGFIPFLHDAPMRTAPPCQAGAPRILGTCTRLWRMPSTPEGYSGSSRNPRRMNVEIIA